MQIVKRQEKNWQHCRRLDRGYRNVIMKVFTGDALMDASLCCIVGNFVSYDTTPSGGTCFRLFASSLLPVDKMFFCAYSKITGKIQKRLER